MQNFSIYVGGKFHGFVQAISRTAASHFAKDQHGPNAMVMWEGRK